MTIKNKYVQFFVFVFVFIVGWNVLDYFCLYVVTGTAYHVDTLNNFVFPVVVSLSSGTLLFLLRKR